MNLKNRTSCIWLLCSFILSSLIGACSNEIDTIDSASPKEISIKDDNIRILQSLGFDTSDIIEMDSSYLVQGDILFEKSKLSSYDKAQTRQAYHTTGLIAYPKQSTITVGIDSSIPTSGVDNWREEILEAIKLWNPLSNLKMTYTTDANPDILVRSDASNPLQNNVIAAAEFPMNGQPGSSIWINLDFDSNKTIPRLQKIYNIVHELGHCFGLRHTNWQSRNEPTANHISGTATSDPNSVMNGGTAENQWKGFSGNDRYAINKLYPIFQAEFDSFPTYINNFGVNQYTIFAICSHQVVSYSNWQVTGGLLVSTKENSATVIFGSPITSALNVYLTTINGETYYLSKEYSTQVTTVKLINQ